MSIFIRQARPDDAPIVMELVRALAVYERLEDKVAAGAEDFERALAAGHARALIAEWDGAPVGLALYFYNFSTFAGRRGLYLEDLYVRDSHRGRGIGKALLASLARIAHEAGCARLEWAVLDWNAPSIAFYESFGARPMKDWLIYRLDGDALEALARSGR